MDKVNKILAENESRIRSAKPSVKDADIPKKRKSRWKFWK